MNYPLSNGRAAVLSNLPAERGQRRLALAVVAVSAANLVAAPPFAKTPRAPLWAVNPV